METKKSKRTDLEWRKPIFLEIGLVIALFVVLMSFEFIGSREKVQTFVIESSSIIDDVLIIQTTHQKELPPPPQATTMFDITDNKSMIDDILEINADIDETTAIDEVEYYDIEDTKADVSDEIEVHYIVEQMPSFPGDDDAFFKFLGENLVYPQRAIEVGIYGRVVVGFVVEPDGRITNVEVVRSKALVLDEEAVRVVKMMPKWNPGKQQGKAVRVKYQVPIDFTLQ